MEKYTRVFVFSLVLFFAAVSVHAQGWGFTGPSPFNLPEGAAQGFAGQQGFGWPQGYTGQFTTVSVSQVYSYPNKMYGVLQGTIVQWYGGDRYLFRDASGDVMVKIDHGAWWGQSIGPNDIVEVWGDVHRDKKTWWLQYYHIKALRKVQ